jgi:hypothetical protein
MLILVELMTITVKTFYFVFSELRWEMIVCFVDIGGTDDHYCLTFFFVFSELRWEVIVCYVDIGGIDDHYYLLVRTEVYVM